MLFVSAVRVGFGRVELRDRVHRRADGGGLGERARDEPGRGARVVAEEQRDDIGHDQARGGHDRGERRVREPVAAQPAKELRTRPEADREQEQQEEALLDLVRQRDAELAHEHSGEQRPGHGAELETAERDLAEQVAEAQYEEECDLGMGTQQVLQPGRHGLSSRARHGGRDGVEPAAEREVQVDALHEPLGLHAHERGARAVHGELLLLHGAQVAGADVVANLRELERLLVRGRRAREHLSRRPAASSAASAFSTSPNARAPIRPYSAIAWRCSAVRIWTCAFSAPPREQRREQARRRRSRPGCRGPAARTARSRCC